MSERISSGSFDFNEFLNGGYEKDVITMIAGPPASGKTNLGILAGCSCSREGKKVIFIDSEGGFSVERVKQIVGENFEEILERFFLLEPVNFKEQAESFKKLLQYLKKEQVGLIVIDGMSMLYRIELMDASKSKDIEKVRGVNGEMAKQMRTLAEIARKQKIPVLITNQVYSSYVEGDAFSEEKKVNIIGGDLFKYWSKCIIQLNKSSSKRKAILLKHRSLPEKEMSFEIRDKGIFKKKGLF